MDLKDIAQFIETRASVANPPIFGQSTSDAVGRRGDIDAEDCLLIRSYVHEVLQPREVRESKDGGHFATRTDFILLDFSKAFDSFPQQRLIIKIKYYEKCHIWQKRQLD